MFVGLVSALAMVFVAAPPVDLDIAPHDGTPSCRPARIVRVGRDGSLSLGGQPVEKSRIVQSIRRLTGDQCERVYIQAEDEAPYGAVFSLISTLRASGFRQIALVDRPWEDPTP